MWINVWCVGFHYFCFVLSMFSHMIKITYLLRFLTYFFFLKKKFKIQRKSVFLPKKNRFDSVSLCDFTIFASSSTPVELNNVSLEKVKTKKEFQKNFECEFFVRLFSTIKSSAQNNLLIKQKAISKLEIKQKKINIIFYLNHNYRIRKERGGERERKKVNTLNVFCFYNKH